MSIPHAKFELANRETVAGSAFIFTFSDISGEVDKDTRMQGGGEEGDSGGKAQERLKEEIEKW